jgi:hypothetical protein
MGVIEFVKDVGRRLGVGDTLQAQSAQAPETPPGPDPDTQKAAAPMRLVEQMRLTVEHLGSQVDGERFALMGTTDSQEMRQKAGATGRERPGGRSGGRPVAGGTVGATGSLLYREVGGHALEDRAPTRRPRQPIPAALRGQPAAAPRSRRDLPGADTAHSLINTDGAPRARLSKRRGSRTWRTR